jgi:hypothetical protein
MSGSLGTIQGTNLLMHASKTLGPTNVTSATPQGGPRNVISLIKLSGTPTAAGNARKINQILKVLKGAGLIHFKLVADDVPSGTTASPYLFP